MDADKASVKMSSLLAGHFYTKDQYEIAALEPTRRPCPKCKGWSLPLGYSYSAVMTKEKLEKSFLKEFLTPLFSGSEERLLTFIVSSVGKGSMLSSLLEKGPDARIKIGKTEDLARAREGKFY
ncbi:MAG: hypothetical protein FGF48_06425 [Candidatus Brockarchaeota archaeon]|nr:hypothetical protein [Candidatus Brockarchaeota archaeon]